MKLTPRQRGTLEISIASVGFGFLGVFGKMAFNAGLNVGEFLTYRFALAAILMWIFMLLFKPQWVRLNKYEILTTALLGIFGYGFFSTLYFNAIEGLSVTLAALLLYTYPFWVNVFNHFFTHDKISKNEFLSLIAAFTGLVLLLWGHIEVKNAWAILAGLGSAISYAIYVVVSAKVQKNIKPLSSSLYVITFGTLALALYHRPHFENLPHVSQTAALAIIGIAIISTILPLTLELAALQKLKSSHVALLMMIEPITATALGTALFGDTLSSNQIIGAGVIITALIANNYNSSKESK